MSIVTETTHNVLVVAAKTPLRKSIKLGLLDNFTNYHVEEAATGNEAKEKLIQEKYHLILCDWELHDINGYKILQWVRAHSDINETPFILMSPINDKDTILKALQFGANAYLLRPFSIGGLVEKINIVFENIEKKRLIRITVNGTIDLDCKPALMRGNIVDLSIEVVTASFKRTTPPLVICRQVVCNLTIESTKLKGVCGFIFKIEAEEPRADSENLRISIRFNELSSENKKLLQQIIYSSPATTRPLVF